jgi:hypothetical protein
MSRRTRSERDQVTYHTFDGRQITRQAIEAALDELESRQQRHERLQKLRTWALLGLLVLILVGACAALVWWRLTTTL